MSEQNQQPEAPPVDDSVPGYPVGGWDTIWQHMSMFEERIQRLEREVLPQDPDPEVGLP